MDRQGVERVWLFPTLGIVAEKLMNSDPVFIWASYRAFNRWLDEDWGFNHVTVSTLCPCSPWRTLMRR